MKKKLLLFAALVAVLACAFAITAFAENKIIKLDNLPTLEEIRADREAYVSHLDAFDTSAYKEKDGDSVVVMSDLQATPTYYVFPAFYILEKTSHFPDVSALNTAVEAADPSAFYSYAATGSRGGNDHIIRIEIPTYVTLLDGWNKFEGADNLKEVYFPTKIVVDEETGEEKEVSYITTVGGQNTFTSCPSLEYIHNIDKLPLGVWNQGCFGGCKSLREVTLPKGLTSIPQGLFEGCYALGNVEIPDGVTSIGLAAFENCDSMTEVILPNSVTSISKRSFNNMNNLVTFSFGAGLTKLTSTDHNLEVLNSCSNLKYVYMPASFATEVQGTGHSILQSGSKVTIFFTGTEARAEEIKTKLTTSATNDLIKNATFVEYDPNINYFANEEGVNYAETLGYTILVYNYSACEAFYNGEHDVAESFTIEYSGERFLSNAIKSKACSKCIFKVDKTELAPLFENLGYSTFVDGTIVQGFKLNSEELTAYEDVIGKVEYGVVAAVDKRTEEERVGGVDVFSLDKYVSHNLAKSPHDYFEIKIIGITGELEETYLFFCAYVKIGEACYYINDGACGETALSTTFNAHK